MPLCPCCSLLLFFFGGVVVVVVGVRRNLGALARH